MKVIKIIIAFAVLFLAIAVFSIKYFFDDKNQNTPLVKDSVFTNSSHNSSQMSTIKNNIKDTLNKIDYLKLHYDAILIDTHNDFIWKVFDKGAVFGVRNNFTQSDLPRFKSGGLDVQVFAIWIPMNKVKRSFNFVLSQIERLNKIQSDNSSDLEFAKTYDDIIRITNEKRICGLIGIEGGTAIEKDLDNINRFYEMGVRYIGLTWNNSNNISTSAKDAVQRGKEGGLTNYGIEVIKRMNDVGMLIDVSHLSEEGFWDVIENSSDPIIASHSNCYSINPHLRNLTDEQIKAIAKNDGYIGINFHEGFLDKNAKGNSDINFYDNYHEEIRELAEKYENDLKKYNEERLKFLSDKNINSKVTIDKVIEHIDYIKNLVGIDYVGIGSDFDGGISPPVELYDASCYPEITKRLVERGYTEEEIRRVLGLNFLRVFKKVCG